MRAYFLDYVSAEKNFVDARFFARNSAHRHFVHRPNFGRRSANKLFKIGKADRVFGRDTYCSGISAAKFLTLSLGATSSQDERCASSRATACCNPVIDILPSFINRAKALRASTIIPHRQRRLADAAAIAAIGGLHPDDSTAVQSRWCPKRLG